MVSLEVPIIFYLNASPRLVLGCHCENKPNGTTMVHLGLGSQHSNTQHHVYGGAGLVKANLVHPAAAALHQCTQVHKPLLTWIRL